MWYTELDNSKFVGDAKMKKYAMPIIMLAVFETVAITLWLTKNNLFYLFNFSYIGLSISLGVFLYSNNSDYLQKARKYGHFTGYKN